MGLHRRKPTTVSAELAPVLQLWLLRILVPLGAHREFISARGFGNDALAIAVGLGHWVDASEYGLPVFLRRHQNENGEGEFDPVQVLKDLRKLHKRAEEQWTSAALPATLRSNATQLARLARLSDTDCRVLEFAVTIHNESVLDDTADWLGRLSSVAVPHALSVILALPEPAVRAALGSKGLLAETGLVSMERNGSNSLRGKLNLLSDEFADRMVSGDANPIDLLRGTVSAAAAAHLGLSDYPHITADLQILLPYLRRARASGRVGVNIFVYGAPGTGKTQLTRAVASELGCELFEVACEDSDGLPIAGDRRLQAIRAAQSFFANRSAMIAFDEVEDVFQDGNERIMGRRSTAQNRKGWMNRLLEENPVPTLWMSNSIAGMDPAFVRRFDMVFELPVPPKHQRERILQQACGDLLDPARLSRIAQAESLAPAVVTKASAVVSLIREDLGQTNCANAFERLISNTLTVQGHRPLVADDPNRLPETYDPRFLHADADLVEVAAGLIAARTGRLCLYGPPGTGKTAYGRWLSEQLGIPLLIQRASDLMSMWVGENEKNIADAFRRARQDGALLLIDEVDSFLQDRRGAHRSWEMSMVNEMLTQMESFSGIFIASTNLMSGLDQAALRRFDLKVKFDFLRPEQARDLLHRHCEQLHLLQPTDELLSRVARLTLLTPGDFAAVSRQHRFRPIESTLALVSALEAECAVKEGRPSPMGFL